MKHVFVESNWVFDFCAPAHRRTPDAEDLAIFAAILVKAGEVRAGTDEVFFCELDGDLAPTTKKGDPRSEFAAEYTAANITFLREFRIP